MNTRIRTGARVQITSIVVLCDHFAGVGLARLLKRITQIASSTSTKSVIAVMIGIRITLWNQMASSRSGVTPGCRSIALAVGWPIVSAAQADTPQNAVAAP